MTLDLSAPISGVLIAADPAKALNIRKAALSRGVILTCLPEAPPATPTTVAIAGIGTQAPVDVAIVLGADKPLIRRTITAYPTTPVIALVDQSVGPERRGALIRAGVTDVLVSPYSPEELGSRLLNAARSADYVSFATREVSTYEDEVRNAIGEILLREYEALYVLGKASEYKDQETGAHIARVAHYSRLIARMVGLSDTDQETIFHASALHDVGKIGIPDSILLKPARLDDGEVVIMKTHTTNGHGMLKDAASSFLLTGAMIALTHHERFDGSGYPMRIAGEEIPLFGRIVCVADVFDALTTRRPYKNAWSIEDALQLLTDQRGGQFDPTLVDAFVYNEHRVRQIFDEHSEDAYRTT